MKQAELSGRPVVASALTSENVLVTADPVSNQFTAQVSPVPTRVERDGSWVEVDPSLRQRPDGSAVTVATEVGVEVGLAGSRIAQVSDGEHAVALVWPESLRAPEVRGQTAVWPDIRPGIDLAVRADVTGAEQFLVVRSRAAAADPLVAEYRLGVEAAGLSVSASDGRWSVSDGAGGELFSGPQPVMWSAPVPMTGSAVDVAAAAIEKATGPDVRSARVDLSVAPATQGAGSDLVLRPEPGFLADPLTEFPVVIDPAVTTTSRKKANWSMVWSDGQEWWNSGSQNARVGYDGWVDNKKSRVFYEFDTVALKGTKISSATVTHKQIHSPQGDCSDKTLDPPVEIWRVGRIYSSTTWSDQPTWYDKLASSNLAHGSSQYCPGYDLQKWSVTSAVQQGSDSGWNSLTLGLRSADEGNKMGWRQYDTDTNYPVMTIVYNRAPTTPGAVSVAGAVDYKGGLWVANASLDLSVKVSDPDGGDVRAGFRTNEVGVSDDHVLSDSGWVSSGGTARLTRTLGTGRGWWIEARADDGALQSGYGPAIAVTVDTTPPDQPVMTGPATVPQVGDTASFVVDSPSPDAAYYMVGLNTDTPTTRIEPGSLGGPATAAVTISRYGPSWVTAYALDRAGNRSATTRFDFKTAGTLPSHRYRLDGNGLDTRENTTPGSAINLSVPPGALWGGGREATGADGEPYDCTDKSLTSSATGTAVTPVTSSDPLDTSAQMSISAWVRPDPSLLSTATSNGYEARAASIYTGDTSAVSLGYRRAAATDPFVWTFQLDNDGAPGAGDTVASNIVVSTTDWTHLVGTWSPAEKIARFYVNGALAGSQTLNKSPFNASVLMIGGAPTGASGTVGWRGSIDDAQVFPGVLDADAVQKQHADSRPYHPTC